MTAAILAAASLALLDVAAVAVWLRRMGNRPRPVTAGPAASDWPALARDVEWAGGWAGDWDDLPLLDAAELGAVETVADLGWGEIA